MVRSIASALLSAIPRRPFASFHTARRNMSATNTTTPETAVAAPNLVAICHMRATHDKEHNRQQVCEILRRSAEQRAGFVFLPECCDFVGRNRDETLRLSEPLNGPTVAFYQSLAREHRVWLSVGGFHELPAGDGDAQRIHNAHLVINSGGELVETYRKLHLFDVDTPDFKFRESAVVTGGSSIVAPLETPAGALGLMIVREY